MPTKLPYKLYFCKKFQNRVNLPSRIVSFSSLPDDEIYLSPEKEKKTVLAILMYW